MQTICSQNATLNTTIVTNLLHSTCHMDQERKTNLFNNQITINIIEQEKPT